MRERDEAGILPPLAHVRLENAPMLRQAVVLAISADPLSPTMTTAQKVRIADNVIDHVIDGFALKATGDAVNHGPLTTTEHFQNIAVKAERAAVAA